MTQSATRKCPVCDTPLTFLGTMSFRVGGMQGGAHLFLKELADMNERMVPIEVGRCDECCRLELFDLDRSIPAR